MTRTLAAVLCVFVGMFALPSRSHAQDAARGRPADDPSPMAAIGLLEGTWVARGDGFSSELVYEWSLPSTLLRVRNELRDEAGAVVGQYVGHYAWDADRSSIVFWTVSRNGELHRGTATWRNGQLWHDATVSGGRISGYRSVVIPVEGKLRYQAQYDASATDSDILGSPPLIYHPK